MSWWRYWALYASQPASLAASAALSEATDGCAASSHVALHASGPLQEANDNAALVAHVALAASAALHEADDRLTGTVHGADTTIVDPNFTIAARPRLRRAAADARIRSLRPKPRVRAIILARRA